jgi:membrane fusion protein
VRKGDRVAVIDLDRQSTAGQGYVREAVGALGRRIDLGTEQRGLSFEKLTAELDRLKAAADASRARESTLSEQISIQEEVVKSTATLFNQLGGVVDKGFVSKLEYERRRQLALGSRQDLIRLQDQLAQVRSEGRLAVAQMTSLRVDSERERSEIRAAMGSLEMQRAQMRSEGGYVIVAPIDGRITALQVARGRTATSSRPIMTIVPVGAPLTAEVYAPTRAVGFVQPGQEVRLLFDAFPYERFGSWPGRVESISKTVMDPRETDVPLKLEEPVYRIVVAVENQAVPAFGKAAPLQPGMTLRANIVLERQSFLDWLLTPLRAVRNREK